jgi:hypothetical protein
MAATVEGLGALSLPEDLATEDSVSHSCALRGYALIRVCA